ncbi:hypothetical protein QQS21_004501 [Conoideocrella luteorostrata]|uniref:Glucose-methanol-choline oxidoreductase N-terminal domain-containing protein n=1 Tax=Conoideocrella luteorostrata TaxID=1105319 RepID=A0AAJ0CTM3_9HYPO|nr:hypothetical protein QQS21_004501 [Conoideocrella luteorostrata]
MATPQPVNNMIRTTLTSDLAEVDVIVVGGGTAGSVIAARLSDAHPAASIVVIEAGPENFDLPAVAYPAFFRKNLSPTSTTLQFYFAAPEPQLANRSLPILAGRTLGGGSAVNLLMYARGQRADFDGWGVDGWSAKELVPFLRKSENHFGLGKEATHGDKGPIAISNSKYVGSTLQKDFIAAFNQIGYPTAPDIHDLETCNAVSTIYRIVSPATGRRQDTAYTYLYSRLQQSQDRKLDILVEQRVLRVLFNERKQATGVELQAKSGGTSQTVKARKLVILSAGAMGTPQILERSGLGDAEILRSSGVPVVSLLPGVGRGYQDHQLISVMYKADLPPSENLDSIFSGAFSEAELIQDRADILSWNGLDASAKIRPTQAEVDTFRPALRKVWDEYFADEPSRPLGVITVYAG